MLHDIGKVGVPDAVLHEGRAPRPRPSARRSRARDHRLRMLGKGLPFLRGAADRPPGTTNDGMARVSRQLSGDRHPLRTPVMPSPTSFDAMTSDRPYRLALPTNDAGRAIRAQSGTQFDPAAVEAFERCEAELLSIRTAMPRQG